MGTTPGTTRRRAALFWRATFETESLRAATLSLKLSASVKALLPIVIVALTFCPSAYGRQRGYESAGEAKASLAEIDSEGAAAVVKSLDGGSGNQWNEVIRDVETGSPAWLEVAKKLLTATDAGRTSDLYFALSIALTRNPTGVLSMVGPDLPVDKLCSVPYIEPDEKTIRMHRNKVRAALQKVNSPGLAYDKKACLNAIAQ
jgi:hypothetical protein